ncbi:molybdenum cofactor biosynthesis protein MoaE [Methylocystis sp. 9N]|uniref:Molybdopterin synthase catalytic subunit n=1 Tax=Methylocystis borbori TaxID=3118750 RepID=A0ABU7XFC5_9HYPH
MSAPQPAPTVRVQAEDFDAAREEALLLEGRRDVGALVAFTGLCRDEDGALAALELEHYPGMAEAEIARVAAEALARWPLLGLTIVHRFGTIKPGERIVLVLAAARSRRDAFAAAEFLMDYLKTRAPFWKKERRADAAPGEWVAAKTEDDAAAERWR